MRYRAGGQGRTMNNLRAGSFSGKHPCWRRFKIPIDPVRLGPEDARGTFSPRRPMTTSGHYEWSSSSYRHCRPRIFIFLEELLTWNAIAGMLGYVWVNRLVVEYLFSFFPFFLWKTDMEGKEIDTMFPRYKYIAQSPWQAIEIKQQYKSWSILSIVELNKTNRRKEKKGMQQILH